MSASMTEDSDFDTALVTAAFALAGEVGWPRMSVPGAARRADLALDRARGRFPDQGAILRGFGRLADQAALAVAATPESSPRDRLFDILMRRMDMLQTHRDGTLALLRALPLNPAVALALTADTLRSMGWMLEAADIDATGTIGVLRTNGLLAVWLMTVRAWRDDDSEDMSATMAALDKGLDRAIQAEGWLGRGNVSSTPDAEMAADAEMMPDTDLDPILTETGEITVAELPHTSPPPPPDVPSSPPV